MFYNPIIGFYCIERKNLVQQNDILFIVSLKIQFTSSFSLAMSTINFFMDIIFLGISRISVFLSIKLS